MSHDYDHLVFRGDQYAWQRRGGRFPYLEHAAATGATGVHVWFWDNEPFHAVSADFLAACRDLGLGVHLGIGIGAYGVCDGEDPLDPGTQARIKDHISATLDRFELAGVEFQTGEYDKLEYQGESVAGKSRAEQLCDHLNPYIDHLLARRPELWLRTELHAGYFPLELAAQVAAQLDPRCTVEFSYATGPYTQPDCFERGRALLTLDAAFTWFLKLAYNRQTHWHEWAQNESEPELLKWAEHWRGWVRLLAEADRRTLTICHVAADYVDRPMALATAAVALARDPELSSAALSGMKEVRS